jgi:hypothetical protein
LVSSFGQRSPAARRGFAAFVCALALACVPQPATAGAAGCGSRHYALDVHPDTIVAGERHRVNLQATCGHRVAVSGARVRLDRYRAITDRRGRATLTVRLTAGRYVVRLYLHRRLVAQARLSAIPNVSR